MAHSIKGNGAIIFPDRASTRHANCFEASDFIAYKTRLGLGTFYFANTVQFSNIVLIDNEMGFALINGGSDQDKMTNKVNNVKIYGEYANKDCPS